VAFAHVKPLDSADESQISYLKEVIIAFGALIDPVMRLFANQTKIELHQLIADFGSWRSLIISQEL